MQCSADAEEVLPRTAVVHGSASAAGSVPVAPREGTQGAVFQLHSQAFYASSFFITVSDQRRPGNEAIYNLSSCFE